MQRTHFPTGCKCNFILMISINLLGIHPINIVNEHESSQVKSILIQVQEHGLNKYTIYKIWKYYIQYQNLTKHWKWTWILSSEVQTNIQFTKSENTQTISKHCKWTWILSSEVQTNIPFTKSENTTYNIKTSQNIVNEHESSQVKITFTIYYMLLILR